MSAPRVFGYVVQRGEFFRAGIHVYNERHGQASWKQSPDLAETFTTRAAAQEWANRDGGIAIPLISQADATAETAKLRALLARIRYVPGFGPAVSQDLWTDIDAALAETEGAT